MKVKKLENKNVQVVSSSGKLLASFNPAASLEFTQGGKAVGLFYDGRNVFDFYPTEVAELEVAPDPATAFSGTVEDLLEALSNSFFFEDLGGGAGVDTNFALNNLTLDADRSHDFNGFGMLLNAPAFVGGNVQPVFFLDSLGTLIGDPILGGKIGDLNGQNATILLIGEGGAGTQYQAGFTASDGLGNEHSLRVNEDGFRVDVQDGGQSQRIELRKSGFEVFIDNGSAFDAIKINNNGISISLGFGNLNLSGVPSFDNDAAAGLGGLFLGDLYQTTGLGLAPLNIAGILLRKQ